MNRLTTLGPSLSCVAMILLLLWAPHPTWSWVAVVIGIASLVVVNVCYIRLYNKWAANGHANVSPEMQGTVK